MAPMIKISLLGSLEVSRDGTALALPSSRKTRALLAYLAAIDRPQQRQHLCELLWDLPDDPRAALRWSLSRLRSLLDTEKEPSPIQADRQVAGLDHELVSIDLMSVRRIVASGVDAASTADLKAALALFKGPLGADLELPGCPAFQAWLVNAREEARRLQRQILDTLNDRLAADPEEVLPYAHARVALDPDDEAAWARLVSLLVRAGRPGEARAQYDAARGVLAEIGGTTRLLQDALNVEVAAPVRKEQEIPLHQEIRFCRAPGGVRIAYATVGRGAPLVKTANWLNHLEYDWESPIWSHLLRGLARRRTLLRYDARGNGLSDWEVGELSLDAWVSDLEAVVDAANVERFPLFGVSQGCAISIAYAVRHPDRVSHLILYSGQAAGLYARNDDPVEIEKRKALTTLVRHGWGQANPAFRQVFTSTFIPNATREQADAFNELQRRTTSPECAARYFEATPWLDVRPLLAQVSAPTLVMHPRGDQDTPIELGRQMAAGIPGAQFVPLPGQNHLFLEGEPAAQRFFEELDRFLAA